MSDAKLSEAELYIMQYFWQNGCMKSDELAPLVAAKNWRTTTLLTFLSRLSAKGMLSIAKQGKSNLYTPLITEAEWRKNEGRAFLDQMYGGSARDFLAAMVDSRGLSSSDISELKTWLDSQEEKDDD